MFVILFLNVVLSATWSWIINHCFTQFPRVLDPPSACLPTWILSDSSPAQSWALKSPALIVVWFVAVRVYVRVPRVGKVETGQHDSSVLVLQGGCNHSLTGVS